MQPEPLITGLTFQWVHTLSTCRSAAIWETLSRLSTLISRPVVLNAVVAGYWIVTIHDSFQASKRADLLFTVIVREKSYSQSSSENNQRDHNSGRKSSELLLAHISFEQRCQPLVYFEILYEPQARIKFTHRAHAIGCTEQTHNINMYNHTNVNSS